MQAPFSLRTASRRVYFGWWMVAGAFLNQHLFSSLLFLSTGAYMVQMMGTFGWTRSAITGAFSLLRLETGMLGPVQGYILDRFGPRFSMRTGTVVFALGFFALGQVHALWQLYAAFTIIAIGASFGGFLTINIALAQWFRRYRARAMAITQTGFASGAILAPLVAWFMVEFGWRTTATVSGFIVLAIGLPVSQIFRGRPEDYGLRVDGAIPAKREGAQEHGAPKPSAEVEFTLRDAIRHRAFWFVSVGHGMGLLVVSIMPVHLVPHLVEQNGWSLAQASLIFPGLMVVQITGQTLTGILGDRYPKHMIAGLAMLGHAAGITLIAFSTAPAAIVLAIVLHGLAWGGRGPLMMAIRADYFGTRNLGKIAGWSNMMTMMGSLAGPLYAALLYDALGTYTFAFVSVGIAAAGSSAFFFFARRPVLKQPNGG